MSDVTRMDNPATVPSRDKTMIPITSGMKRIGAAITHDAKPKKGIIDIKQTRTIRTQLAVMRLLFRCADRCTVEFDGVSFDSEIDTGPFMTCGSGGTGEGWPDETMLSS